MISKGAALGVLDRRPGVWFCIRCWALALGVGDGAYAELRDLVQSLATGTRNVTYDTVHNEGGNVLCEIQDTVCERTLTGPAAYSGWRWSIRRRTVEPKV